MSTMVRLLLLITALSVGAAPAHAQDDTAPAGDAVAEAPTTLPQYVWTTEAVTLVRWPGTEGSSASIEAGRRIEVILQDGEQARVRSGTDFGWLPVSKVSATEPAQE